MIDIVFIMILLLVFAAIFALSRQFFLRQDEEELLRALGLDTTPKATKSFLLRYSRPLFLRFIMLTKDITAPEWRRKRQRDLLSAGMTDEIALDELLAYKMFMSLLALFMLTIAPITNISWWTWVAAAVLGFYYPDLWVKDRVKQRAREVVRMLPDVVDMLGLSVSAGLDFISAIEKVVTKSKKNALVSELSIMLNEMRLGATRSDVLRNIAYRCNVPELSSFVAILLQADKLGISISQVLRSQSENMRSERFQRAERMGAAASQKMLFPLVLFIMPATFIVIIAPLIVKAYYGKLF